MTEPDEGIVRVNVHELWQHESTDFTPWLAENLHLLGEELDLNLEPVQQERLIGSFYLDILAMDTDQGVLVAIENQLEWTDHSHLGQLLTYATGLGARIVIWVAPQFRYEHAKALHRLNEWKGANVSFYGVKVEAIKKTGDSELEPRLLKVVWPGGWNQAITLDPVLPPRPEIQQHQDFFRPIITKLLGSELAFADTALNYFDYSGRRFTAGPDRRLGYAASFERGAWAAFSIRMGDTARTNRVYDELHNDRAEIESSLVPPPGSAWHWIRHDPYSFSAIGIGKSGTINDPPEKLEETRAWMLDLLPKLKSVFGPRVEQFLSEQGNEALTHGAGDEDEGG